MIETSGKFSWDSIGRLSEVTNLIFEWHKEQTKEEITYVKALSSLGHGGGTPHSLFNNIESHL